MCLKVMHMADAFAVEATGAVKAAEFAPDIGLQHVIIEGDSLGVIRKIASEDTDLSPIGLIVDEAWARIKQFHSCSFNHIPRPIGLIVDEAWARIKQFHSCSFNHIPRAVNICAHTLAKLGLQGTNDKFWLEVCPEAIAKFVYPDVNNIL
ncbi:hypothetical protein REPUB_Repub07fG0022900 [Reevesia pubescens]